jgi:hypothetical protein
LKTSPTQSQTPNKASFSTDIWEEPKATFTAMLTVKPSTTPSPFVLLTPTVHYTPLPTLEKHDALVLIQELFKSNRGCQLPCWWGITPGETPWPEALQFLHTFASDITIDEYKPSDQIQDYDILQTYHFHFQINDSQEIGWSKIYVENYSDAEMIVIGSDLTKNQFTLPQLFAVNGVPEQIYLYTYSDVPEPGPIPFIISVFSSENRYLAVYKFEAANQNGVIVSCQQSAGPNLFLWSPEEEITDDFIQMYSVGYSKQFKLRPIHEVTKYSVQSFYEEFKGNYSNICIETDASYW